MENTGKISADNLEIRAITPADDLSHFSCSEKQLNAFFVEDALQDHLNLYSITQVVKYEGEIAGFFTLIADNITLKSLPGAAYSGYHYDKLPAVKIARLATDEQYERRGIGQTMLMVIFSIIHHVSQYIGCRVVTVDAKSDAVGFYKKFGFREVTSKRHDDYVPLYIDIKLMNDGE